MLDTFGFPTPQGSNYQEFYGGGSLRDWIKPRGASMVRMLLIGAGAGGIGGSTSAGGGGGGSGSVTSWIGPAIFIPDQLRITIGAGGASATAGGNTTVIYQAKSTTGYNLLTANGGSVGSTSTGGAGGTAFTNNYFGASGIFRSTAGQAGSNAGAPLTASTTIFLTGGAGGSNGGTNPGASITCNYGYPTLTGGAGATSGVGKNGFFLTQPIMFGVGGSGGGDGDGSTTAGGVGGRGGIGCGGGGGGLCYGGTSSLGGRGGDGAVFIWAW